MSFELSRADKPEDVGLSSERLQHLTDTLKSDIDKGIVPGAVALIARRGKIAYETALGYRDREAGTAMEVDTIFRVASMTKPLTSLSAMMLAEDGKLSLDDRVSVEGFGRPVDAVVWATRHIADLVLIDYMMPEMNGIELAKRLRALPGYEQVPIIMVTVSDDRDVRYAALDAGATDFLAKPVDTRECLARCRNLLTLRRQQIALEHQTRRLEETMRELRREWHARERDLALLPPHVAPFKPRKRNLSAPT